MVRRHGRGLNASQELERACLNEEGSDLDAIEALFKKLNEAG
jgi:hypothetical protein